MNEHKQRRIGSPGQREKIQSFVRRLTITQTNLAGQALVHRAGARPVGLQLGLDIGHGGTGVVGTLQRRRCQRTPVRHPGFP